MSKNDGGPAFPVAEDHKIAADIPWTAGMTLRDWFAGQALAGLLANPRWYEQAVHAVAGDYLGMAAHDAGEAADAMLAERAKGGAE